MFTFKRELFLALLPLMLMSSLPVSAHPALSDTTQASDIVSANRDAEQAVEAYRNNIIPVPVVAYTPETSLMMGSVVIYRFKTPASGPETRASQILGSMIYTLNRQIILEGGLNWIEAEETMIYDIYGGYNFFPSIHFAPGFNSRNVDERTLEYKQFFLEAEVLRNIEEKWFTGPILNAGKVWDVKYVESDEDHSLQPWTRGNPEENVVAKFGWSLRYDERNSMQTPTEGRYFEITTLINPSLFGAEGFWSLSMDARRYWKVENSQGTIIAGQISGLFTGGKPPFQAMPGIGGAGIGRGYHYGRFNDQNVTQLQFEIRQHVWWRFGVVGFVSAGEVWNGFDEFSLSNPKYAGGAGLRFDVNPRDSMNIRIDYGMSPHGSGLYVTIGEAF